MTDFAFVTDHTTTYFASAAALAGTNFTITWTASTVDSPCGAFGYAVSAGSDAEAFAETHYTADGSGGTYSFTLTHDAAWVHWSVFTDTFCSTGTLHGVIVNGGAIGFCGYGTEANPDAVPYELVTDGLIDLVVAGALAGGPQAALIPYVETALGAIEGSIFIGVDCSTLPGAGPTLDFPNLSTLSTATLLAWFRNAAWRFFCRCVPAPPGGPPPLPPDVPPIIPPTTVVPVQPQPLCDNSDLCSYLAAIKAQLQVLTAQLSYLRTDVRLLERQTVPFSYVPGTLHSGLTGAGTLAVSAILGVSVQLTTIPASIGELFASPNVFFNVGWVTTGPVDGWRQSTAVGHNPQWIDAQFDDTQLGYSFTPGVVANIQTFSHEP